MIKITENMANYKVKLAGPSENFEQGFFQLAYDKLQSKLFNLLPYLVGFEVVRKTDDGTKSVGVFGFKSDNGQILFVPVFFMNGKVKELDTLYSRNNNQFYPLTEDFAALFLKDEATGMGSASYRSRQEIVKSITPRNYRQLIQPPQTGRTAYASAPLEYERDALKKAGINLPTFVDFVTCKIKEAHTDLIEYVTDSPAAVKQAFWNLLEKDADYTEAVRRFYTDEQIASAMTAQEAKELPENTKLAIVRFAETLKAKTLPDKEKGDLFRQGFAIVDNRDDTNKSKYGLFKFTEKFGNPTASGFYPYITEMGTIRHGLILVKPQQLKAGFSTDEAIVIDLEADKKGQAYITNVKDVYVKDQITVKDFSNVHKQMEDAADALPSFSNTFVLINDGLKCTQPFRILENYKDSSGIRRIKVEPEWYCDNPCSSVGRIGNKFEEGSLPRDAVLVFTKRVGEKLEFKNNTIYVPKGYKLLKVDTSTYFDNWIDYGLPDDERKKKKQEKEQEASHIRAGKPGTIGNLTAALSERNVFPLTVRTNGSDYFSNIAGVKKHYANPIEAKIGMVMDYGLAEKSAEELITELIPNIQVDGYIKMAVTGEYYHQLVDEAPYTNEFGQATYQGQPYSETMAPEQTYQKDPTEMGLGVMGDNQGIDYHIAHATNMAQTGQKEIFDTQSIATLAKYNDPANKILSYVPNFVTTLDKLGRILFMLYWETEKFQKMYGKDELPELVELIKNVFKNMGELVIFLKRKIPDLSINSNEQAPDQI